MIHLYDKMEMVYTGCWQPPFNLETTTEREEVTCLLCLVPRDAEAQPVLPGNTVLMPNGRVAVVDGISAYPLPEVVVIFQGQQVTIPAAEVILL